MEKVTKGQNFRFGFFDVPSEQRLRGIKEVGFDETMFWWGPEYDETDGTPFQLFDAAQKLGLGVTTCHFPSTHADWLWKKDDGPALVQQFCQACAECGERKIKHLVLHTTRKFITPEPNEWGLVNFGKMLDAAVKHDVVIALENTRFLRYNDYLLQHFDDSHVGFCFDSGHANCYTPNEQPLEKYGAMLVTTHIHDNSGPTGTPQDKHLLMGEGNVNFDNVFARLKHFGVKHVNLESYCNEESRYFGKLSAEEFLRLSFQTLSAQMEKSGL